MEVQRLWHSVAVNPIFYGGSFLSRNAPQVKSPAKKKKKTEKKKTQSNGREKNPLTHERVAGSEAICRCAQSKRALCLQSQDTEITLVALLWQPFITRIPHSIPR